MSVFKSSSSSNSSYKTWQPFLLSLMVVIGMILGYKLHENHNQFSLIEKIADEEGVVEIGRIEEVIRFIEAKYVDETNSEELVDLAINAVINELDPHSIYIPEDKLKDINTEMNGGYIGIGVETMFIDDTVRFIDVFDNSPAQLAGLQIRDALISIDDSIVVDEKMSYTEIRSLMKKEKGEELILEVLRDNQIKEIKVASDMIAVNAADISYMLNQETAYVKIDKFTSKTYGQFATAIESLKREHEFKHLVIDVRNNPGGYLPEATDILCQLFREKDRMLVYTEGKKNKKAEYKTTGKPFFNIENVAVLIDEGSASGSEILAGAIQDWDRGVVVGRRTFGKGLVQEQYPLSNGGALRLTIAKYFTPSGRSIQRSYSKKENYYTDIDNRLSSGELTNGKGINEEFDDSTQVYQTKLLNRPLPSEGGIYPDIFVPIDTMKISKDFQNLIPFIDGFAYAKFNEIISPDSLSRFLEAEVVDDEVFQRFKNFVFNKGGQVDGSFFDENKELVKNEIKSVLAKLKFGELAKAQVVHQEDPVVLEALKAISTKDVFSTLLEKNEN